MGVNLNSFIWKILQIKILGCPNKISKFLKVFAFVSVEGGEGSQASSFSTSMQEYTKQAHNYTTRDFTTLLASYLTKFPFFEKETISQK